MKIDFVPPPALLKLIPMLRHSGSGLAFEDIFSSKDIDGASTSEPLAGRAQQVFSFNELGILGAGLHTDDEPQAVTLSTAIGPQQERPFMSTVGPNLTAPTSAGLLSEAVSPTNEEGDISATGVSVDTSILGISSIAVFSKGTVDSAGGGVVVKMPVGTPSAADLVLPIAGTIRDGAGVTTGEANPAEAQPAAKRAMAKLASEAQTPSAAEPLNVTVANVDGILHVAAAAPNLTETARLKIRAIAEDLASETGAALGDVLLNGTLVMQPHNAIGRSLS